MDYITALVVSHFFFCSCSRDKQLSGFRRSLRWQPLGGSRQPLTSCTLFLEKTSGKRSALTSVSVWKKRDVNTCECEWSRANGLIRPFVSETKTLLSTAHTGGKEHLPSKLTLVIIRMTIAIM